MKNHYILTEPLPYTARYDLPAFPDQAEFLAWAEKYANHLDLTIDLSIEALENA
jgi:hypothetical protein